MKDGFAPDRRRFLAIAGAGLCLLGLPHSAFTAEKESDVGPAEDLMREHGALNRILLIYEEGLRRIRSGEDAKASVLLESALIVRNFIEAYHEKLEEDFVFPRLRKAGKHVALVNTLEAQHKAGRSVTDKIVDLSRGAALRNEQEKSALSAALESFIRMYRPHEAREDTVVFPAFHGLLGEKEYDALGEKFEDREHKLFGKNGFEGVVLKIAGLEKEYEIYDVDKFTPRGA